MASKQVTMDIVQPTRQKAWGMAAVVNFWLGGMSTAAYILLVGAHAISRRQYNVPMDFLFLIFFLMSIGFLFVALHAGRPDRARYAAIRFRTSWMAREAIAGFFFFVAALLNFFFPHALLAGASLLAAFFFLLCQSLMPYKSIGIGGWAPPVVPALFSSLSFSSGVGLVLLSAPLPLGSFFHRLRIIACLLIALNVVVWLLYVYRSKVSPPESVVVFRTWRSLGFVLGGGMLLPLLLLLFVSSQVPPGETARSLPRACEIFAGVALIAGAFCLKYDVIARAGWWRALRLEITPRA